MNRKVYTAEEKERYVLEWQSSAQSAACFAEQQGIKENTFYKWLAKAKKSVQKRSGGFVELPAASHRNKASSVERNGRILIRAKGVELEIEDATQLGRIAELIKAMASL